MKRPLLRQSFRYKEQDPDYKGQQISQAYGQGPQDMRSCTDIFFCIMFLILIGSLGYLSYIGFSTGNPSYLFYPFDKVGNQCGYTKGYEDYPYIFISEYASEVYFVCVKTCPTQNSTLECKIDENNKMPFTSCTDLTLRYDTQNTITYCRPSDQTIKTASKLVTDILTVGVLQDYFSDLYVAWKLILAIAGVCLLVCIIYSILIRFFAGFMVWLMIILLLTMLLVLGVSTAMISQDVQLIKDIIGYDALPDQFKDTTYFIVVSCLCLFSFTIGLLIVCCMTKQIRVSIGIIKAAADFVRNCCGAFFIPLYIAILQLLFLAFWITSVLYLFSSNSGNIQQFSDTPFGMIVWNTQNQRLIIFQIFALIWVINFFSGLQTFWVSSSAAFWYFEQGNPNFPVLRSFCRSFYHLGSLALGSLLIAIVMIMRIMLQFINNQLKQKTLGMSQGKAVNILLKCSSCLIACFERLIRFITQNAYIMIAITGKNFCNSAKESFYLMLRSSSQFFISHGTTKLFINIGTTLIITICCVIGYFFITNIEPYKNQIQSPVFLTIIFALVSLPIAWAFMQFFQKGANTILMCYCVELDLAKKRYKCPQGLKNFLQEYAPVSISQQ